MEKTQIWMREQEEEKVRLEKVSLLALNYGSSSSVPGEHLEAV